MKKILIATLFLFVIAIVNAKEKEAKNSDVESAAIAVFSGSIADQVSGESLVGVEVKLEGTDFKTYTDFDGNFSFENVKPGEYKLLTKYISYEKKSELLSISAKENEVKIKLHSSN